jgi:hypothetical protein
MRFRRAIAATAIVAFLPLATTACFGKFNLTRKIYTLNKDVSTDKWVQWIAFLVLSIVPIYSIGVVVDTLILNSIEFWTGENPVTARAGEQRAVFGPNGEIATTTLRGDGAIDLEVTEADGTSHYLKLVRELGGVSAYDRDGRLIANMNGTLAWAE